MRYQDLRAPRGAGWLWLELRVLVGRSRTAPPPLGRLDALSDYQLKDIGLERRGTDESSVACWRLQP